MKRETAHRTLRRGGPAHPGRRSSSSSGTCPVLFKKAGIRHLCRFRCRRPGWRSGPRSKMAGRQDRLRQGHPARPDGRPASPWPSTPGSRSRKDSKATFSSLGLLGEKYVEIIPGRVRGDTAGRERCLPGEDRSASTRSGTCSARVGDEVKSAGRAIKDTLGPETRANLNRTLENLASVSSELKDVLGRNRDEIGQTVGEAGTASETLDRIGRETVSAAAQGHAQPDQGHRRREPGHPQVEYR